MNRSSRSARIPRKAKFAFRARSSTTASHAFIRIGEIGVDAEFAPSMIYLTNEDRPGFIGRFAGVLGDADVNIATFALGRDKPGGGAVALVAIDGELPAQALTDLKSLPGVKQATTLKF